jgi:hypothetical protein
VAGCGRGNEYYLRGTEPESGCGGSIDNYEAQQDTSYPEAASLPQPTVPPASATPPPTIPPLPTESPLESPSPEPTVERR